MQFGDHGDEPVTLTVSCDKSVYCDPYLSRHSHVCPPHVCIKECLMCHERAKGTRAEWDAHVCDPEEVARLSEQAGECFWDTKTHTAAKTTCKHPMKPNNPSGGWRRPTYRPGGTPKPSVAPKPRPAPPKPYVRPNAKPTRVHLRHPAHPGRTTPGWERLRAYADAVGKTWDDGMADMDTSKICTKCWEKPVVVASRCRTCK